MLMFYSKLILNVNTLHNEVKVGIRYGWHLLLIKKIVFSVSVDTNKRESFLCVNLLLIEFEFLDKLHLIDNYSSHKFRLITGDRTNNQTLFL